MRDLVQPGDDDELEQLRRQVTTLRAGLESNRLIGTAVGLVMARHHLDRDAAFRYLLRLSQDNNTKLVVVARGIVDRGENRAGRP